MISRKVHLVIYTFGDVAFSPLHTCFVGDYSCEIDTVSYNLCVSFCCAMNRFDEIVLILERFSYMLRLVW
jgi:hypothetical protein